jgi:hypothetical protein
MRPASRVSRSVDGRLFWSTLLNYNLLDHDLLKTLPGSLLRSTSIYNALICFRKAQRECDCECERERERER